MTLYRARDTWTLLHSDHSIPEFGNEGCAGLDIGHANVMVQLRLAMAARRFWVLEPRYLFGSKLLPQ